MKVLGEPTSSESGGAFGITAGASLWRDDKNQISIVFVKIKGPPRKNLSTIAKRRLLLSELLEPARQ